MKYAVWAARTSALACFLAWLTAATIFANGAAGAVHGKIKDASGAGVAGAIVVLSNPVTGYRQEVKTDGSGAYVFYNVPFNRYTVRAEAVNFAPGSGLVDVRSSLTVESDLTLTVTVADAITVEADTSALLETDSSSTHIDIDKSLIKRFPAATSLRGIESIILSAPGFIADENGRFHFRGSHGQVTYVIDGVQVSDQLNLTFSNSLDPSNIEAMEVITGNQMPEFGGRNAATINITSKSAIGSGRPFFGNVTLGGARFGTFEYGAQFGGEISKKFGYFVSLGGTRSNRFSDPPNFQNFNNSGDTQRLFTRLEYNATDRDNFRLTANFGRTARDIPNLLSQEQNGQNQRSFLKDASVNLQWQHVFGPKVVTEVTPFFRTSAAQLVELTGGSTPLSVGQDRHLTNYGINANISYDDSWGRIRNRFKAGFNYFRFPVSENFAFAITDPDYNRPVDEGGDEETFNPNLVPYDLTRGGTYFRFNDGRTGRQTAFFVQNSVSYRGLTVSGGVRYDNYDFLVNEDAWQPRVGIAYHIAKTGTVLRASYNRLFFTPFNENLLLTSSPQVGALVPPFVVEAQGQAQAVVRAERQHAYEVGIQQAFRNWFRVDFAYWTKDSKQASDNSQFLNTGVVFPVAFAGAKLRGADFRLDVPERRGFSGYLSLGTAKAVFIPPFTGGLFIDPEVAELVNEGPFRIDHDQKLAAQVGAQYNQRKQGWWLGAQFRYDSGLVTEIEDVDEIAANPDLGFGLRFVDLNGNPTRVKPRSIWNLSGGYEIFRSERYKIELQGHLLNLTNQKGLFNFLSVFGGTHVIPPRTFAARVKFNF